MKTPLSPQEKQQLWRHYQAQKQRKKRLDAHLKRDLKHGWLFPYLTQTESLIWGRWQYWKECQLLPEVAWERWRLEKAIALIENRKPEAIPKFVIEHTLPDREIPQISWAYNEQTEKMLIDCLDAIPVSGGWNSWSSWSYLTVLKQKSSPNKAQTSFISGEYVAILVEPFNKTVRDGCTKCGLLLQEKLQSLY